MGMHRPGALSTGDKTQKSEFCSWLSSLYDLEQAGIYSTCFLLYNRK